MSNINELTPEQVSVLFGILKTRFEKNMKRHHNIEWNAVHLRIETSLQKLWSLHQMENTGGEPDVIGFDELTGEYIFYDCSAESPKGRRSLCYDRAALDTRKEFKPENNAIDFAAEMGIELLTESQYLQLQTLGDFDTKTSSWLSTPDEIRKLGGALFADYRFGRAFIYHNGAQSYYSVRGFRGSLRV